MSVLSAINSILTDDEGFENWHADHAEWFEGIYLLIIDV